MPATSSSAARAGRERRSRTEERVVEAATALFAADGYRGTSLVAVAERAGVSERTVYVRFGSKVALFQRVVEVAVLGDLDAAPLPAREWSRAAFGAPDLATRIEAFADGVAAMNDRLGPLMAVNGEVEASEPAVHASAQRWRRDTADFLRSFWARAAADGLLPADAPDVAWLAEATALLSAAETALLARRTFGWDRQRYRDWLVRSWTSLAGADGVSHSS